MAEQREGTAESVVRECAVCIGGWTGFGKISVPPTFRVLFTVTVELVFPYPFRSQKCAFLRTFVTRVCVQNIELFIVGMAAFDLTPALSEMVGRVLEDVGGALK